MVVVLGEDRRNMTATAVINVVRSSFDEAIVDLLMVPLPLRCCCCWNIIVSVSSTVVTDVLLRFLLSRMVDMEEVYWSLQLAVAGEEVVTMTVVLLLLLLLLYVQV